MNEESLRCCSESTSKGSLLDPLRSRLGLEEEEEANDDAIRRREG